MRYLIGTNVHGHVYPSAARSHVLESERWWRESQAVCRAAFKGGGDSFSLAGCLPFPPPQQNPRMSCSSGVMLSLTRSLE